MNILPGHQIVMLILKPQLIMLWHKVESPLAYPVLTKAAKDASYRWEPTGATESLLTYAKVFGKNGDI